MPKVFNFVVADSSRVTDFSRDSGSRLAVGGRLGLGLVLGSRLGVAMDPLVDREHELIKMNPLLQTALYWGTIVKNVHYESFTFKKTSMYIQVVVMILIMVRTPQ